MEDLKLEINKLKEQISSLVVESDKRKRNQIQLPIDVTSVNVLKDSLKNQDLSAKSITLLVDVEAPIGNFTTGNFTTINATTGNITTVNLDNIAVGGTSGINSTISILDGDGISTHTLTFKKGVLTSYSKS